MCFIPVNIKKEILKKNNYNSLPHTVNKIDSTFILEQLDLIDLQKDLHILLGIVPPKNCIDFHKDGPILQGLLKWSIVFVSSDDNNISGAIEIGVPLDSKSAIRSNGPVGNQKIVYKRDDCKVIDTWDLKNGACYFNPVTHLHGVINYSEEPLFVFSLRSATLDIEKILKRISA
jgi:hypothetical protein